MTNPGDTLATLPPPPFQVPGAIPAPSKKDDDEERYKLVTDLANSAGGSVPFLGMGKTLLRYAVNKVASKTLDFKSLVRDSEANPIAIGQKLDEATKKEWRDWLPETVREFCGLDADQVQQLDKVMAVQIGLTNADVFDSWELFYACTIAFNHRRVNFEWMDKPSYMECAWACVVLRALRPNTEFGPEVWRFLCSVMLDDGVVFFPWIGGEGIALDAGESRKYVRGLTNCQALAEDMKKVWDSGVIKTADPAEMPDVDESDPHHVQLAKLMNGVAFIRANEGSDK